MTLEDIIKELFNHQFSMQHDFLHIQQENLQFEIEIGVEMQRLSDQLA